MSSPISMNSINRFWSKVEITGLGACWEWTAYKSASGYGQFSLDNKLTYAHRVAYILIYGEIPNGTDVHHKCGNSGCVNPLHLRTMSHKEHTQAHKTKEFCHNGHDLTSPENRCKSGQCKPCKKKYAASPERKAKFNTYQREIRAKQRHHANKDSINGHNTSP